MTSTLGLQLGFRTDSKQKIVEVGDNVIPLFPERAQRSVEQSEQQRAAIAREVLFGLSPNISGILGCDHPFYKKGVVDPSMIDGYVSLIRRLHLGNVEPVPLTELKTKELRGSAAIIGGPVANAHARLILGKGEESPLLGIRLPLMFDLSKMDEAMRRREKLWRLIVAGNSRPLEECLVITVLPMGSSDRIVNIAGLHSPGTRAIDLVLQSDRVLGTLQRETRDIAGWQALIEVTTSNDAPIELGTVSVFPLDADFSTQKNNFRSALLMNDDRLVELSAMLPFAPLLDQQQTGDGNQLSQTSDAPSSLYSEDQFDKIESDKAIDAGETALGGSPEPRKAVPPALKEVIMRDAGPNQAKDAFDRIMRRRFTELRRLRSLVDANWLSERPPSQGNLELATRFVLQPQDLTPDELREVQQMMDSNAELRHQIEKLSKRRHLLDRDSSHSE